MKQFPAPLFQFPALVFRCPGPNQCAGGTYAHMSVGSEEEFLASLDAGWFETLPEAIKHPARPQVVAKPQAAGQPQVAAKPGTLTIPKLKG